MAKILIVDDSSVARRTLCRIVEQVAGNEVLLAEDGEDALQQVRDSHPDLVVTDMVMPKMDGLQLVGCLRKEFPQLPTVLVTGYGSEELAVQALREGAASYVPKRLIEQELLRTVRTVLEVSLSQRDRSHLLARLRQSQFEFVLENDVNFTPSLIGYLQDHILQMGLFDEADLTRVGVALHEALANALYHGNLEISSELRDEGDGSIFYDVARERSDQSPYRDRTIHVRAILSRDHATMKIRDQGPGFDPGSLPDPTSPPNLEYVSGRGVMLMRMFMDEVEYNETGNEVTLTKRRSAADEDA